MKVPRAATPGAAAATGDRSRARGGWLFFIGLALALAAGAPLASAQQAPAPSFSPPDGASVPTNVTISSAVGALVYFTTDGSTPTNTSPLYTASIYVTNTTTFRARVFLAGFSPSEETNATYYERPVLADAQKLVANDRTPAPSVSITVTPRPEVGGYAIEETIPYLLHVANVTGNGVWDADGRTIRWGPFPDGAPRSFSYQVTHAFDGVYEISSRISLNGYSTTVTDVNTKATVTLLHPTGTVATPVFTPPGGTSAPVTVSTTCATSNAVIYFTTDGRVPGTNDTLYTGPLALPATTFLRARGFRTDWEPSDTAAAAYWLAEAPGSVVRTITNGTGAAALVNLAVTTNGVRCEALVERLPNFLEPSQITGGGWWQADTHSIVWGPFRTNLPTNFSYSVTGPDGPYALEGTASFDGWIVPVTGTNTLTITQRVEQVATPVFTPGSTNVPVSVTLTCATAGAAIYFTTNGAVPTTNDALYTAALGLMTETFLRARAFRAGWLPSDTTNATYYELATRPLLARSVVNSSSVAPEVRVSVAPLAGTKSYAVEERLPGLVTPTNLSAGGSWDAATATIRWGPFRDEAARTLSYGLTGAAGTHALEGTGGFDGRSHAITGDTQVVIISLLDVQVATPVLSPPNSNSLPVAVTISCATAGAEIHYTTDSTVPGLDDPIYSGPLTLAVPTVLRARAFKAGMTASDTVTGHYEPPASAFGTIVRIVTNNVSRAPASRLVVTPAAGVKSYAVEEVLPAAVEPEGIAEGGVFDRTSWSIKWGPFRDGTPRTLSYALAAPDGDYAPDGTASFDGWSTKATGDTAIIVTGRFQMVATPVFNPPTGTLVPVMVTITCATPGARIYFTTNSLVPTTNDPRYTASLTFTTETVLRARAFSDGLLPSDTASAIYFEALRQSAPVRSITGTPATTQSVAIAVAPQAAVETYGVEESVPLLLTPFNVSHGGVWNSDDRMIRWGPFRDHTARLLTYAIGGPDGDYPFSGGASFDGRRLETTGAMTTRVYFPPPSGLMGVAGNGAGYLFWRRIPSVAGYYVYYWAGANSGSPLRIDAGIPGTDYFAITGLTNNTEYYFSVTSYDQNRNQSGWSENVKIVPTASGSVLGFVQFDRGFYTPASQAVITVVDSDLNSDPGSTQTVNVRISSEADAFGFIMRLVEAGLNTNRFTSEAALINLTFTFGDSNPTNKSIKVTDGARVFVVYDDVQPALGRTNAAIFDATPPVTTLVPSELFRLAGGTNYASITFTYSLVATDAFSGVQTILYGVDAPPSNIYTQSFALTNEGPHTVQFRALDGAGVLEAVKTALIQVENDFDHDELPDLWERQFAGNLTTFSATNDYDGDGLTDWQEFQSSTNPADPRTRGRLVSPVRQPNGTFECDLIGEANREYRIQVSSDLVTWAMLTNLTAGGRLVDLEAVNYTDRFYRAVTP